MADAHKYQAHEVLNRVLNSGETALQVDIVAGAEYAEDSEHTTEDTGNFVLGVRNDTLAELGGTDGDYVPFQMNADGALYVEISSGGSADAAHVDDAGFTLGTHSGMMMMGFAGTQSVDANDAGAIAMETDGSVHIHDGGNTITVDGTVTANLSATDNAVLDTIDAVLDTIKTDTGTIDSDTDAIKTAVEAVNQAAEGTISATTQRVTIATDDDGVAHLATIAGAVSTQMQVDIVADGAGLATSANQLADGHNVTIDNSSGGSAVNIQDGGNTITVDGTVDLGSTATTHLSEIEGAVETIETTVGTDGSAGPAKTLSVGGTESGGNIQELRVDSDGHLQIDVLSGGGGTEYSEDAVTPGTIAGLATMMERDDALGGLTPAEGDWASLRCDANGALWTHDDALDAAIDGSEMQVDVVGSLPAGSAAIGKLAANSGVDIGDVDVTSVVPGVAATSLGKAIQSAQGGTDTGVAALVVRNDVLADLSGADGDYAPLQVDKSGALYTIESTGQLGSLFEDGTEDITSKQIIAIQFLEDTTFTTLTPSGSNLYIGTANQDGDAIDTSNVFPQGMTIFGRWTGYRLASGSIIAYKGTF